MANNNRRSKTSQESINNSHQFKKVAEMTQSELWHEMLSKCHHRDKSRLKSHLKEWIGNFIGN